MIAIEDQPEWFANAACKHLAGWFPNEDLRASRLALNAHLARCQQVCLTQCPVLAECDRWSNQDWLAISPQSRPIGVTGGVIYGHSKPSGRKPNAAR